MSNGLEAAIAAKLEHPNIVRVYDFGRLSNGHMYLVMELASGETLKSYVMRNGPLEPTVGVDLMRQITDALVEIHENHVVHRDIKPTNIVLINRPNGQLVAKLIDFGIVKDLQSSSGDSFRNHGILGSPMFMSPEQISVLDVDHRSDLYALGLTFFFVFSGRIPIQQRTLSPFWMLSVKKTCPLWAGSKSLRLHTLCWCG